MLDMQTFKKILGSIPLVSSQSQTILEAAKVSNVAIERSYSSDYRGVFLALISQD